MVLRPTPVRPAVERIGKLAYLTFVLRILIEIHGGGKRSGEEVGAVHGGELAVPDAPSSLHV